MNDPLIDEPLMDEAIEFADEEEHVQKTAALPWKILVVDDDDEVHKMTNYVLKNFTMEERPLDVLTARSGAEAREILSTTSDVALILLDVVMESDDAGLRFVKYVRDELQDRCVQIVLRTGQPGLTCELDAIIKYEINDYKTKTELSAEKLFTAVASSLRAYSLASSYRDMTVKLGEELELRIKAEHELEESKRRVEEKVWSRTQELLEAKEKAEYSLRNRSEFIANVSHEIRTPLNGILSTIKLLSATELTPEPKGYVKTLSGSATYLLAMVNDIMDFSKIEEGKMTLSESRFDLREVVESIGQLLSPVAADKGLELHVDYSPQAPQFIRGDANRVRQIIMNLAGNGIKYTKEGHVLIKVSVDDDELQHTLSIRVTDTGVGISQDQQESIFERFVQSTEGQQASDSSGLGLFITKHLVDIMGGTINLLSVLKRGSSFVVRLPIEVDTEETTYHKYFPGINRSVLLRVNDSIANGILKKRLIVWGFDVIETLNLKGPEEPPSFAIVDSDNMKALKNDPGEKLFDTLAGVILLKRADQMFDTEFSSNQQVTQLTLPLQTPVIAKAISKITGNDSLLMDADNITAVEESIWPQFDLDVLVADDESVNRTVIRIMLEKLGCRVTCAENGKEAVDAFGEKTFDIIFLDHRMPVMNGTEAAVEMKRVRLSNCPPIYALTGDDLPSHRKLFFAAGMKGVVSKPIDWEQLMGALQHAKV